MGGEAKHECGIAAVLLKKNGSKVSDKAVFYLYKMLLNMQSRGQLSAGITTYNPERPQLIDTYKNLGLVNEVFKTSNIIKSRLIFEKYKGNRGIGHVRYATFGKDVKSYAQPFERHHGRKWKWFSFCFNGNLANYSDLKEKLLSKVDYHIIMESDTEIIMHYLSRNLQTKEKTDLKHVFAKLSAEFDGAYNIAYINSYGDMAITRDPLGIRPVCYGETDDAFLVASESVALTNCGVKEVKDLEPGEIILVHNDEVKIERYAKCKKKAYCMFEWVYFANVCSTINKKSVYVRRRKLGEQLARMETIPIDEDTIVVPVPDTAKPSGDAMAFTLGIPSKEGLVRNRFVGRTFIERDEGRRSKVKNKFTVLKNILEGKKVILVDDSIVRGTTSREIVKYLKDEGGAKEVHLRIACPPVVGPCFYGIDMSSVGELFAPQYIKDIKKGPTEEELAKMAKILCADSLKYMTMEGLEKAIGLPGEICTACIGGDYPTPKGVELYEKSLKDSCSEKKSCKRCYED